MLIKRFPQSEKFLFHPLTPFSLEPADECQKHGRVLQRLDELEPHLLAHTSLASSIDRFQSSPQSCVKVQPHQKHNVLRCEPNCHAFLSEERGQEQ